MANTVRPAKESDIPAIMDLLEQVNRIHHEGRPDLFNLATKYTEDELRAILEDERTPVFVCVDDEGRVLGHGFCVFQQPPNTELFTDVRTLYVDDMCVDDTVRNQHVGSTLFSYIEEYARQHGCYNVTFNVWSCNPNAIAAFEKIGFVPYKTGMEKIIR